MNNLEFIGLVCVALCAMRIADFVVHVLIGYIFSIAKIEHLYFLGVDIMSYSATEKYKTSTGTYEGVDR